MLLNHFILITDILLITKQFIYVELIQVVGFDVSLEHQLGLNSQKVIKIPDTIFFNNWLTVYNLRIILGLRLQKERLSFSGRILLI